MLGVDERPDVGSLAGLGASLRAVVAGLDPSVLEASTADGVLSELISIGQLAHAGSVLVARRAVESGRWKAQGERSAGHHLARRLGTSVYAADQLLAAGRQVVELPVVETELRAGALSARKAQLVIDAARRSPGRQVELVGAARRESLVGLRALHDAIVAATDERSDAQRHADARKARRLRSSSKPDATFELSWSHTTSAGAELLGLLQPFIDAEFKRARDARKRAADPDSVEREHPDAVAADAVLAMARAAHHNLTATATGSDGLGSAVSGPASGASAKVIVRIDHTALLRGTVSDGEVCEILGVGPVPVTAVRELMDDAFIAAIVTNGVDIRSVVHLGRKPTALQRTALEWRDPTCAVTACAVSRRLEIDHCRDWAETRHTTLDELARLCEHDHDLKSHDRYTLQTHPDGTRDMQPPQPGTPTGPAADRQAKARRKRNRGQQPGQTDQGRAA